MEFVNYDLAKKLKEKGFDWETSNVYERNTLACRYEDYPKPTTAQVLKWLREAKRIDAGAVWDNRDGKWIGYINEMDMPDLAGEYVLPNTYYSYEKAAIAVIEYVLDNLI